MGSPEPRQTLSLINSPIKSQKKLTSLFLSSAEFNVSIIQRPTHPVVPRMLTVSTGLYYCLLRPAGERQRESVPTGKVWALSLAGPTQVPEQLQLPGECSQLGPSMTMWWPLTTCGY